MGATDKGIPFVEPDDLIAGWPAADELQAEKIDGLLPPSGGTTGQVLGKTQNADGQYDWMTVSGGDGSSPDLGNLGSVVSGESDNQLQLSDHGGTQDPPLLYVPPVWIDADVPANLVGLPTSGQPLAFFGKGRPDGLGDPGVSYSNTAIAAPTGSIYTFAGSELEFEAVYGARAWHKTPHGWRVTDGYVSCQGSQLPDGLVMWKPGRSPTPDGVYVTRTATTATITYTGGPKGEDTDDGTLEYVQQPNTTWLPPGTSLGAARILNSNGKPTGTAVAFKNSAALYVQPAATDEITSWAVTWPVPESAEWPSEGTTARMQIRELRELIEAAESPDHPQHEQLQQLKDELAELTGTKPGGDK